MARTYASLNPARNSNVAISAPISSTYFLFNMSEDTLPPQSSQSSSHTFPRPATAVAVVVFDCDVWWLALPISDTASEIRSCKWLYPVTDAERKEGDPYTFRVKESVKIAMSTCFVPAVQMTRLSPSTLTMAADEKDRIDAAFKLQLAAEAEQAVNAEIALKVEEEARKEEGIAREKQSASKRSREGGDEQDAVATKTTAKKEKPVALVSLPSASASIANTLCVIVIKAEDPLCARMAHYNGTTYQLVEQVPADQSANTFHPYGIKYSPDDVIVVGSQEGAAAAVPTSSVVAYELSVSDAQSLMQKRNVDYSRRQQLLSLPPPPQMALVHFGNGNWAFTDEVVPAPILPSKPKGIIRSQDQFHHFIHNGIAHSVPVATWNAKVSEVAAGKFCRNNAKEAEIAIQNFFLMLHQVRNEK